MAGEFSSIVCSDGLDEVLERLEEMYHHFSQCLDVLSDKSVARATMLMIESILLDCLPVISPSTPTVSLELARYVGRSL